MFYDELKILYPNTKFNDNTHCIKAVVMPLNLKLYNHEYLELIKIINFNLAFDDLKDSMFYYDFEIQKNFKPT